MRALDLCVRGEKANSERKGMRKTWVGKYTCSSCDISKVSMPLEGYQKNI